MDEEENQIIQAGDEDTESIPNSERILDPESRGKLDRDNTKSLEQLQNELRSIPDSVTTIGGRFCFRKVRKQYATGETTTIPMVSTLSDGTKVTNDKIIEKTIPVHGWCLKELITEGHPMSGGSKYCPSCEGKERGPDALRRNIKRTQSTSMRQVQRVQTSSKTSNGKNIPISLTLDEVAQAGKNLPNYLLDKVLEATGSMGGSVSEVESIIELRKTIKKLRRK